MSKGDAPIRLLVVDDEPDVRLLLGFQLRSAGFEVVGEAGNGRQALDSCAELRPDAVVFDLLMPGMSGFAAIPALQAALPDVGIVAYTAVVGDFVRAEMERLGVALVLKTGDAAPIVEALRACVKPPG